MLTDTKNRGLAEFKSISDRRLRGAIRKHFGITNQQVPIRFGDAVEVTGEIGGFETLQGTPIHAPSSYAAKGWSNMRYVTDSRVITITKSWLTEFIRQQKPYSGK